MRVVRDKVAACWSLSAVPLLGRLSQDRRCFELLDGFLRDGNLGSWAFQTEVGRNLNQKQWVGINPIEIKAVTRSGPQGLSHNRPLLLVCFVFPMNDSRKFTPLSFHELSAYKHRNKTKFEWNSSLEYSWLILGKYNNTSLRGLLLTPQRASCWITPSIKKV